MKAATALRLLRDVGSPVFTTADAAAVLDQRPSAASKTLERLAEARLAQPLFRGLWSLDHPTDPYVVAAHVATPHPGYVSLQSALYLHGAIDQIPSVVFVVSPARTHAVRTPVATYSVHHVAPDFFGGFELRGRAGIPLATPAKAIADLVYLGGTRVRLFASLPEIELPRGFRWADVEAWLERAASPVVRGRLGRRYEALRTAIRAGGRVGRAVAGGSHSQRDRRRWI